MSDKTLQEQVDEYLRSDQAYRVELERGLGKRMRSLREGAAKLQTQGERIMQLAREKGWMVEEQPRPEDFFEPCEVCQGRGVVGTGADIYDPLFGKLVACPADCDFARAQRMAQLRKRVGQSQLPDLLKGWTFDSFDAKYNKLIRRGKNIARYAAEEFALNAGQWVDMATVLELAGEQGERSDRQFSFEQRNSLVFFGPMGAGKTGLAAAIVNYLMSQGVACLYMRCRDMIADVMLERRAFGRMGHEADDAWTQKLEDTIKAWPVLLIDEANTLDNNTKHDQFFEDLIRYRYMHKLATIVTGNKNENDFELQWGGRTAAAMRAMAHWIPVGGVDLRRL